MAMSRSGLSIRVLPLIAALALSAGCVINPVTGERELALVSAADEVAIGNAQYLPAQQMQGGEYIRDPGLTAYVQGVGSRLAAVSERDLPYEFVVIDSSVPNAWALPGGKIAINRGLLLELESEAELAAVLGHEIVHAAARHGAQAMQRGILIQGALTVAAVATSDQDYGQLAVGAASLGAQLVHLRHGRGAELEADEYGMRYMSRAGYDPSAAVSLQQTFVRLSGTNDGGRLSTLFASHPPSQERVEQNRMTAAMLPAGGTVGREAYRNATAALRQDAPGYEALDEAREALAEGNLAAARSAAARAAEVIPDAASVAAIRGDIELAAGRPEQALIAFEQAVARNARFFRYHVGEGEAHRALNQLGPAADSYETSLALLPTADAYYGLGRIAETRGNIPLALEHYRRAAESSGRAGQRARAAILRLDLPANPGNYLTLESGLDSNGQLIVQIGNPTGTAIGGVTLAISYVEGGSVRQVRRTLSETLAPGTSRRYATGLGPFSSGQDYDIRLDSATPVESP